MKSKKQPQKQQPPKPKIHSWKDTDRPTEDQMLRGLRLVMRGVGSGAMSASQGVAMAEISKQIIALIRLRMDYDGGVSANKFFS